MLKKTFTPQRTVILFLSSIMIASQFTSSQEPDGPNKSSQLVIEFGRGSGLNGLDYFKLHGNSVELYVRKEKMADSWKRSQFSISNQDSSRLQTFISENKLLMLDEEYADKKKSDGTQWVLWMHDSMRDKVIYMNNAIPASVKSYAAVIDDVIKKYDGKLVWEEVSSEKSREHEKEIWDRVNKIK